MHVKWIMTALLILATAPSNALSSDSYSDAFTTGIDTLHWTVSTDQPLYTVDDSNGDVRFAKPIGGSGFQYIRLDFRCTFTGDFDASVDFSDAMINRVSGTPGNQVQLNLVFGGQLFAVVRSDESPGGDNYHVFLSPPGAWAGAQSTVASQGTLRVVRTGSVVSGYFNGTLIHSGTYNSAPVTFMTFSLQNNGTNDPTSVTFDNFALVADSIDCPLATAADPRPRKPSLTLSTYPNPFNPSTTIALVLPADEHVALRVYDITGRLVRSLLDEDRHAGYSEARWDGRDDAGSTVPSGLYFIRASSAGESETVRALLLK